MKGNHDEQASLTDDLSGFNPLAEEAINWTRRHLDRGRTRQWLRDLKMVRQVRDFTIVHATLDTPHKWGYVFNQLDAAASFNYQHTQLCFYGHTHAPRAYIRDGSVKSQTLDKLTIEQGKKYFINVGSVGQPRDGDWHASYCLFHPDKQTRRVAPHRIRHLDARRIKSSPPGCRSGSRIGSRWENKRAVSVVPAGIEWRTKAPREILDRQTEFARRRRPHAARRGTAQAALAADQNCAG